MSIEQIADATKADEELQAISSSLKSGEWDKSGLYYAVRHKMPETGNGRTLRGTKIFMSKLLQAQTVLC